MKFLEYSVTKKLIEIWVQKSQTLIGICGNPKNAAAIQKYWDMPNPNHPHVLEIKESPTAGQRDIVSNLYDGATE